MMSNLSACCKFQEGYVNPSQKDRSYFGGNIKRLRVVDLTGGEVFDTSEHLSEKGFLSAGKSAYLFPKDSIVISKSGTIGQLGIIRDKMCGNRAIINIEVLNNADMMYIFYLLKYKHKELVRKAVGSIQKNLYVSALETVELCHNSKEEQKRISDVLVTIDKKINLNNKINSELEAMAKELYEYWFVQFDFPNENGKPYKSSGGKMVYNDELKREIPEGWEVKMIKDTFGSVGGYSFSSDDYVENGKYKLYTIGNVQDGYIVSEVDNYLDYLPYNMPEECLLKPGEMLMSLTGNVGRVGFVYEDNALLNQRVLKLQSEEGHKAFMYMTFIQDSMRLTLERISNGTSQKNLSPINMGKLKIVVPPEEVLKKYDSMCNPMIDKMVNNFAESQKLSELRDFLLPMLMNGQVTVK